MYTVKLLKNIFWNKNEQVQLFQQNVYDLNEDFYKIFKSQNT